MNQLRAIMMGNIAPYDHLISPHLEVTFDAKRDYTVRTSDHLNHSLSLV
jgi:hypothetical protein